MQYTQRNPWRPGSKLSPQTSEAIVQGMCWGDSIKVIGKRVGIAPNKSRDNYNYFLDVLFTDAGFIQGVLSGMRSIYVRLPADAQIHTMHGWVSSIIPWTNAKNFPAAETYCAFDCQISLNPSEAKDYRSGEPLNYWPSQNAEQVTERAEKRRYLNTRLAYSGQCKKCKSQIHQTLPDSKNRLEYLFLLAQFKRLHANPRCRQILRKCILNLLVADFLYFINLTYTPNNLRQGKDLIWNLAPQHRADNEAHLKRFILAAAIRYIHGIETSEDEMKALALKHFEKQNSIIYHYEEMIRNE